MGTNYPKPPLPLKARGPHLTHPSFNQPYSPLQMASRSNQPFCHSTLCRPTDRPTYGVGDSSIPIPIMLYLDLKLQSTSVHMKGDKYNLYSFNSTLSEFSKKSVAASVASSLVELQANKASPLTCDMCRHVQYSFQKKTSYK